ncbi:MBL fold metallo-hydrolase [Actinobacteria bacterium YIM 96077]|uniref:MBL fold metallo-hydrolase n=1 Tax=Phytoactinopolyspora halophila TaxID=1981511 RepID=A0A329QEH3_9ACTN|nr:MBL fold metallo-hydrolase [Phytoactinopolyspora halophila]AYY13462.1 MBL fold metallo-hydrolase [Actinobacteria bacterium YIM 96077]RAW10855.1 MBL fold metallo-hydrolase [Phytoactinopolyspora halophila]
MLLLSFASPVLGTNCYIVARDGGEECLLVDPGIGIDDDLEKILAEHALRPVAALVTHGHVDHTFALGTLCQRRELPVYIHEADAYRLDDPIGTLGPELAPMLAGLAGEWSRPPDVRFVRDGASFEVAGITVRPWHAPGHTEGSVLYHLPQPDADTAHLCFTGDVLFAGTIGRTDLPGGDPATMERTLAEIAKPESGGGLPDATSVLPGHGDGDTLGNQRLTNPFLRNVRGLS